MFQDDFKEWLRLLTEKKVEYLLVGGYAVALYGIPRTTGDLDIWIRNSEENVAKVIDCLNSFGFSSLGFTNEDLLKPYAIIQLGFPPVRIDIITDIDGVSFDDAIKNCKITAYGDLTLSLISIEDLIKNKSISGRKVDLADVEKLKKLRRIEPPPGGVDL